MPDKISILKESGETLDSNVVSVFKVPETDKKYIITTENAVDPHGLTVLHVSEISDGTLQKVATDEEWSSIKTIMRAIISGNVGSYQYLPTIENINAAGQYSRDISVSASASKQMIDNYAAGDKSETQTPPAQSNAEGAPDAIIPNQPEATPTENSESSVAPASIFPTGNDGNTASEDELIPGITEFDGNNESQPVGSDANAQTIAPTALITEDQNVVPTVTPEVNPVTDVVAPPVEQPVDINVQSQPSIPDVVAPMNEVASVPVDPGTMVPPVQVVQNVVEVPQVDNVNPGVQVLGPTQVVPTAQIAQGTQATMNIDVKFDESVKPSFDPNATLDEVVMGAQAMFMEGVKGLVQTIQEKVYRDLYNKEIELKNREVAVEQKEKMMMAMMSSFNPMAFQATQPVQQMVQPMTPMQQPMMQQTPMVNQGAMVQPNMMQMQQYQPMQQPMMQQASVVPQNMMNGVVPMQQGYVGPTAVSAANDIVQP